MSAGTGANTQPRRVVNSPVFSLSCTGSQVVPLGQVESLQQTSTQMPRVFSQMPLRHSVLSVQAAPETRTAVDTTQAGSSETMFDVPLV